MHIDKHVKKVIHFPTIFRFFTRNQGTFAAHWLNTSQRVPHKLFCQRSDFSLTMSRCYHHIFQVEADTVEGEVVAVTGSSGELGRWRRNCVVPLVRESDNRYLWHMDTERTEKRRTSSSAPSLNQSKFRNFSLLIILKKGSDKLVLVWYFGL